MKAKGMLKIALGAPLRWGVAKVRVRMRRPKRFKSSTNNLPLVIGHRGFSAIAPENTLPAFEFALTAGVDLVELDYRQTADGELVVIHDADLDRTTDARTRWNQRKIRVEARTVAEIKSLDAGAWFGSTFAGVRVPLLREALQLIQPRGVALLERKSGDATSTARLLEQTGSTGRVVIQSFDWNFLRELHELLPSQPLAALGPLTRLPGAKKKPGVFGQLNERWLKALSRTGASVVVWNKQVSLAAVRQAHERGLKVWIYTVDRPELARRLLDLGVDGLITNNPAVIWKSIAVG